MDKLWTVSQHQTLTVDAGETRTHSWSLSLKVHQYWPYNSLLPHYGLSRRCYDRFHLHGQNTWLRGAILFRQHSDDVLCNESVSHRLRAHDSFDWLSHQPIQEIVGIRVAEGDVQEREENSPNHPRHLRSILCVESIVRFPLHSIRHHPFLSGRVCLDHSRVIWHDTDMLDSHLPHKELLNDPIMD